MSSLIQLGLVKVASSASPERDDDLCCGHGHKPRTRIGFSWFLQFSRLLATSLLLQYPWPWLFLLQQFCQDATCPNQKFCRALAVIWIILNLLHEAHSLHEIALLWIWGATKNSYPLSFSLSLSQFQVSNCCHATTSTSLAAADAVLPRLDQNRTEQRPQPGKWLTARTKPRIGANKCTSCTRSHQRHLNRFHVVPRSQVQLYTLHWISHPNILGFWSHAPICKKHWKTSTGASVAYRGIHSWGTSILEHEKNMIHMETVVAIDQCVGSWQPHDTAPVPTSKCQPPGKGKVQEGSSDLPYMKKVEQCQWLEYMWIHVGLLMLVQTSNYMIRFKNMSSEFAGTSKVLVTQCCTIPFLISHVGIALCKCAGRSCISEWSQSFQADLSCSRLLHGFNLSCTADASVGECPVNVPRMLEIFTVPHGDPNRLSESAQWLAKDFHDWSIHCYKILWLSGKTSEVIL